jgi:hypothetical protein
MWDLAMIRRAQSEKLDFVFALCSMLSATCFFNLGWKIGLDLHKIYLRTRSEMLKESG